MLNNPMPITIRATEDVSPTQTYAHSQWQHNPAISPDYWHESQGHTHSRIALNWQTEVTQPELLAQGTNLLLTTPATLSQAQAAITTSGIPTASFILLHSLTAPQLERFTPPAHQINLIPLYLPTHSHPEGTPTSPPNKYQINTKSTHENALKMLEELTHQGHISSYGLADNNIINQNPEIPLHEWLEMAATAASHVHGRQKRPALRWLAAPLSLLNLNLLTSQNTQHKQQVVSPLELAARLHLATIGVAETMPNPTPPPPVALQALTHFAQAEQQLSHTLGGWPTANGQPLFSALAILGQGQAPWPTPQHWQGWQQHVFPILNNYFTTHHAPQATAYLAALTALIPHGPALATAAAQPLLHAAIQQLSPHFPNTWHAESAATQAALLLSSLPALTALALTSPLNINPLQVLAKHPNPSFLLQTP